MCVLIKDLAEIPVIDKKRRQRLSGICPSPISLKSFPCVSAPDPEASGFGTALTAFSAFFLPQKVHYNALFTKFRPKHAL
jgi:hypothetical protein